MSEAVLWNSQGSRRGKPVSWRLSEPGQSCSGTGSVGSRSCLWGQCRQAALTCVRQWDGGPHCSLGTLMSMTRSGTPSYTLANGRGLNAAISHQEAVCKETKSRRPRGGSLVPPLVPVLGKNSPLPQVLPSRLIMKSQQTDELDRIANASYTCLWGKPSYMRARGRKGSRGLEGILS